MGDKQILYEDAMKEMCDKVGIDYNLISQGVIEENEAYRTEKQKIVQHLCRRYCCRQALMNYIDVVKYVKG
jgi:DNA-directed RNA polymerase subunit N (RpoN/RPB10)